MHFLKIDDEYLKSHKIVPVEKNPFARGTNGAVFHVKNNKRLIVKEDAKSSWHGNKPFDNIKKEMKAYKSIGGEKEPFFVPSKIIHPSNAKEGLAKPRLSVMYDPNKTCLRYFTKSFIERLRHKIIELSYNKIVLHDGLQIGHDSERRVFQFDTGTMYRTKNINHAFNVNNDRWQEFSERIGKEGKIGSIKRTKELDNHYLKK